jgi:Domain of unknown function (DUF3806)
MYTRPPNSGFRRRGYSAGVDAKVTPLTEAHEAWLREQLAAIAQFLTDYGSKGGDDLAAVEHAWASWLDRQAVDPADPDPVINAVGVYFGQALIQALEGFGWAVVEDDSGTDLAVFGLPGAGDVIIYPASVVAQRYQDRDAWFLQSGRDEIVAQVQQVRAGSPGNSGAGGN